MVHILMESCLMKHSFTSTFGYLYDKGELPLDMVALKSGEFIWKSGNDPHMPDYHCCLPIFCDGLRETYTPYAELATKGVLDLLARGKHHIVPVLPWIIVPIKLALETHIPSVMTRTLFCLQHLLSCHERIGKELVKYYRFILPACAKVKNLNIRWQCDVYSNFEEPWECYDDDAPVALGDMISETLGLLEFYGGEDALLNIRYMVPTYESFKYNA